MAGYTYSPQNHLTSEILMTGVLSHSMSHKSLSTFCCLSMGLLVLLWLFLISSNVIPPSLAALAVVLEPLPAGELFSYYLMQGQSLVAFFPRGLHLKFLGVCYHLTLVLHEVWLHSSMMHLSSCSPTFWFRQLNLVRRILASDSESIELV